LAEWVRFCAVSLQPEYRSIQVPSSQAQLAPSLAPSGVTLSAIQAPVLEEMRIFRKHFREAMRSPVRLLDLITRYVLRTKGKQLRPLLVFLSAKACGNVTPSSHTAAALVELLHTATLVHDDVVDEAEKRRGFYSIQALWKRKVAVLFGDFLLARGLLLALDNQDYRLLHIVSDAVRRMSEGELLQIEKSRRLDIDEKTYFRIISDKTASLISACTTTGAVSAASDDDTVERMRRFGEHLGLAFQIRDDLFDFGLDNVGKPLGLDVQEKKMTLPLIVALERSGNRERAAILDVIRKKRKNRSDLSKVRHFAEANGGIEYARTKMLDMAENARVDLSGLPPSPSSEALNNLVDFVVQRSV
jgi:octaprenyl-diphosphate synthase